MRFLAGFSYVSYLCISFVLAHLAILIIFFPNLSFSVSVSDGQACTLHSQNTKHKIIAGSAAGMTALVTATTSTVMNPCYYMDLFCVSYLCVLFFPWKTQKKTRQLQLFHVYV